MKTPNLDREIETYEIHKKQGYLTEDGEKYLAEFKAIKQALRNHDVVGQSEQLPESEKLCRMNQNFVCNCIDNSKCPNF